MAERHAGRARRRSAQARAQIANTAGSTKPKQAGNLMHLKIIAHCCTFRIGTSFPEDDPEAKAVALRQHGSRDEWRLSGGPGAACCELQKSRSCLWARRRESAECVRTGGRTCTFKVRLKRVSNPARAGRPSRLKRLRVHMENTAYSST